MGRNAPRELLQLVEACVAIQGSGEQQDRYPLGDVGHVVEWTDVLGGYREQCPAR